MAKTQKMVRTIRVSEVNLDELGPIKVTNEKGAFVTCGKCGELLFFPPEQIEHDCFHCHSKVMLQ